MPIFILFVSLPLVFPVACITLIGAVSFGIGEKLVLLPIFTPQVLLEKSPSSPAEEIELIFALVEEPLFTSAVSLVSEFSVAV